MPEAEADIIVVGMSPGGSATATNLTQRGVGVLLLGKDHLPYEKVYGDRFTPRTARVLVRLGIDTPEKAGWPHNKGLCTYGGRAEPFRPDWPKLVDFPSYGLVQKRADFDDLIARRAVGRGAKLVQGANVTEVILDDRTGRIVGVRTRNGDEYHAPPVVAADGSSSRLSISMSLSKRSDCPMGMTYRAYYRSPRGDDDYFESRLELWNSKPRESTLMPGYGWIFGMGDDAYNVGLGVLNTSRSFQKTDYRELTKRWLANTPREWGFREESWLGKIQGATLLMTFSRQPIYGHDLLLVGGSGGMVNPSNGERIVYAMKSTELAANATAQAHVRRVGTESAECALYGYCIQLKTCLGGRYQLRTTFVGLIGGPRVIYLYTTYGLSYKTPMCFIMKLLANLTDNHGGDIMDRVINVLYRVAPAA